MDQTAKQTALFFGFLAVAMTQASAQAASSRSVEPPAAVERGAGADPAMREQARRETETRPGERAPRPGGLKG